MGERRARRPPTDIRLSELPSAKSPARNPNQTTIPNPGPPASPRLSNLASPGLDQPPTGEYRTTHRITVFGSSHTGNTVGGTGADLQLRRTGLGSGERAHPRIVLRWRHGTRGYECSPGSGS